MHYEGKETYIMPAYVSFIIQNLLFTKLLHVLKKLVIEMYAYFNYNPPKKIKI